VTRQLREPELPRSAKVRTGALRSGWTTGACAAAAAKAAALLLRGDAPPETVEIPFPSGDRHAFAVERTAVAADARWAQAVVVKDAGDDPDVTHGAHVTVRLEPTRDAGITFRAGDGVGTVTKPGLGLDVGGAAINPVPRAMISAAVREALPAGGLVCTVSVPDGERMARKTTNARLGIVGGISILGTTGIVRPFSTASWRASVVQAVAVAAAQGIDEMVLSTGGRTERAAQRLLPGRDEVSFVEVGDFTGAALREMTDRAMPRCRFVGMAGKLAKLGAGVLMTHYTRSRVDLDYLADVTAAAGGDPAPVGVATTARHAYELWQAAGIERAAAGLLCADVAANLTRFTDGAVTAEAALVDFDTLELVAASPGWSP
jgi:cobalt-precorrin-5B (C1)-methyltransferase